MPQKPRAFGETPSVPAFGHYLNAPALACRIRPSSVHHLVQVRGCAFYIEMLVLSRPAFRGEHRATVNSFEVAMGKLVSFLGVWVLLIITAQSHFVYSRKPFKRMDLFSIAVEGWSSLHASLIAHNLPLRDEFQVIDTTVNG